MSRFNPHQPPVSPDTALTASKTYGLSLIEVLIALLVLSVGLVGMASLQLTSLKSAHSSYYRSLASAAALDTEERLWLEMREKIMLETSTDFCMSSTDISNVIAESQAAWRPDTSAAVSEAGIPGLTITAGTINETSSTREDFSNGGTWTYRWQELPIRLTWTDNRLGAGVDAEGNETDFTETFDYVIRIPCVSDWTEPT